VLLYMQNSPQFVLAYYGILRADAVVVPVNPMNRTAELEHYVRDTGATLAFAPQELFGEIAPLLGKGLTATDRGGLFGLSGSRHAADRAGTFVRAPRLSADPAGVTLWSDMLAPRTIAGPAHWPARTTCA
jgi:fatty-acyl-CoA synthase